MCGRFTLKSNLADWIGSLFEEPVLDVPPSITVGYNIAPTQFIWTITCQADRRLRCEKMFWGLLPAWVKSRAEGAKLINARSETILEKPTFRKIVQTNRCLIPTDGYYEWQKLSDGSKQPHWITRVDHQPFFFAAIWQTNQRLADHPQAALASTSIVTTHANERWQHLHDRMPLMLFCQSQRERWLDDKPFEAMELEQFARPPADDELVAVPVSNKVSNARNQGPDLIETVAE